ncbi:uncharacterized protein LOC124321250 [Daphnia pulicaria]|uniref:uncharacterized protein LOC124321250 n=1 Tax=Daphnia pulicaria TaxID=35523 RepID=UPI001EEC716F|nr:uncharacterized protein LOC124321250 [Daphnia pulicaria]
MKWIFSLFILLVLTSVDSELFARTNSSNLCSRIPSQSCLHQLSSSPAAQQNSQVCTVEAANNTHPLLCGGQKWNREDICQHDGCGVHLEIYRHMPYPSLPLYRTALNLTLSNVSSSKVKIRFHETSINNFAFCINFTTSSNAAQPFDSLWYDCVFHSRQLEGQPFQLEFLNGPKYGLYLFQLPTEKDVRNGHGFLYVHLHHSPNIVITFQETSGLQTNNTYLIVVCKWHQNNCHIALQHLVDLSNSSTFTSRFKDSLTVSLGKLSISGNFTIKIEDPNCNILSTSCYQATSSFFIIQDFHGNYIFFLPVLGVLVIVALCVSMGYRKKIQLILSGMKKEPIRRKTVLLAHDSTASDYSWIEALKLFLEKWGGFEVLVDFVEIPRSRHKDPLLWYTESMETADWVAVVAPPPPATDQRSPIYRHTFDLALELLAMRISRRLKLKERDVLQQFVVVQPEGGSVPDVCSSFSRFRVPQEFANLISYMDQQEMDGQHVGGPAANHPAHFVDCLRPRSRDNESKLMDSFRMIHQHLVQRNQSLAAMAVRPPTVDDAQHVEEERSSLLNSEDDRERKRQELDRQFGPAIVRLADLPTLG